MKIIKMSHSYVMTNNKIIGNIHTIELYLWYSSYFGDSLTACRLSVYELGEAEKELRSLSMPTIQILIRKNYYNHCRS